MSHRAGILRVMYFSPHTGGSQPCWHCTHFVALVYQGTAAKCSRDGITAMPIHGCAFWEREVGADDEPGPPVGADTECRALVSGHKPNVVSWAP